MKRFFKYWLQVIDSIWQVPLSIGLMIAMIMLFMRIFGPGIDVYQPTTLLAVFLSWAILALILNFARFLLYFTLRGIHKYIFKHGQINEDWKLITPCQRIILSFSVFLFFVLAALVLTIVLI
jgi:hypothetical protein